MTVLCPVDFSDASRGALRYGAAIADKLHARVVVMTATDPLLAEAAAMESSAAGFRASMIDALRAFVDDALDGAGLDAARGRIELESVIGKPDAAILLATRAHRAALVVISSHGLTGFRKLFFGSTTERVLRETPAPVLVVPGNDRGPRTAADAARAVRRVLVPVLLPPPHAAQLEAARAIAAALDVPPVLLHVVEPLRVMLPKSDQYLGIVERERRLRAEHALERIAAGVPRAEALVAFGEPAEEIAKVAHDRRAGLIVMGLYASPGGARIGSVTYRVLCTAERPVLALPAGNFSQSEKKPARRAKGGSARSPQIPKKSRKKRAGTARALKSADTRFDT